MAIAPPFWLFDTAAAADIAWDTAVSNAPAAHNTGGGGLWS